MLAPPSLTFRDDVPRLFAWRAALLFCAPMLVNGIGLLYFPVFLQDMKMSDVEIGLIVSIPFLVRLIGMPLGAFLADRASDRTIVMMWSAIVSFVSTVVLFFAGSFWPIAIVYAVQSLFYAPYVPIAEAILVTGVRRWGFDYGFLRMWGSVAFVLATLMGGWLLDLYGGRMVLPAMAIFFVLTIVMAILAPRLGRLQLVAADALDTASSPVENPAGAGGHPFWRTDFLMVIVGAALVQGSHGMLFGFATNYWSSQGISGWQISLLWTAGVAAEITLFFVSGRWLNRFSIWTMILFGSLVTVGRWAIFPYIDGFWPFLLLQSTHAFTFAIIHVAIQRFMMGRIADGHGASAQGFYQAFICLFNVATTWSAGYIFQRWGVHGFHAMAVVAAAGVVCVLIAERIQPQSSRAGG